MSSATMAKGAKNAAAEPEKVQSFRETVESIVVAFVLAFLFRAFVAEAFVIPTGSMAPTLMGAHKDIVCTWCGQQYQAGASKEFDQGNTPAQAPPRRFGIGFSQPLSDVVTVASTCSTCRGVNAYDFRGQPNHTTFSGDRILVSKFDYILSKPKRWDVFVFKFPTQARMNYIKRLVGLPGESLLIRDGDVYVQRGDEEWNIARKPPHKIKAMRQIVSDTDFLPRVLVESGWPSLWQPLVENSAWAVQQEVDVQNKETQWSAELSSSPEAGWLRYYHKFLPEDAWLSIRAGQPVVLPPDFSPKSSMLITDYLAYNSSFDVPRMAVYDKNGYLSKDVDGQISALDVAFRLNQSHFIGIDQEDGPTNDGFHWVGDLISDFEVEVKTDSGTLLLDLVEFGIHYQCAIDVSSGRATLTASESGKQLDIFNGSVELTAQTKVKGKGNYRLELANVDDQLVLWVNGWAVDFDQPATFDSYLKRGLAERRPHWTEADPLDAAPIGIGGQNIAMRVNRAVVYRDIYYIAIQNDRNYSDYDWSRSSTLRACVPDAVARAEIRDGMEAVASVYAHPEWWEQTELFAQRGELRFDLAEDHYFPMGDNSSASSDARAWMGHHYVEEKFLLGKALLVFWPHTWNRPIPFTPNFARMGRIR